MATITDAQIATAVKTAGFRGNDARIAVAVALAESGGNPQATNKNRNGSTDYGLFQINSIHKDLLQTGSWSDPVANARMAHTLWSKSGWRPWVAYTNGSYMRFIVRADRAVNNPNPLPNNIDPNAPKPTAPDAGGDVLSFIDLISDGRTWQRIGMAVIGAVILIYAAAKMTGDNKLGGVAKGAINVGASALAKKPIKVA